MARSGAAIAPHRTRLCSHLWFSAAVSLHILLSPDLRTSRLSRLVAREDEVPHRSGAPALSPRHHCVSSCCAGRWLVAR